MFNFHLSGKWSGGGRVLRCNVDKLIEKNSSLASDTGIPVFFKNVVPIRHLFKGDFVYVPQNAWAWEGPAYYYSERIRRFIIRVFSLIAIKRCLFLVRIGPSIPRSVRGEDFILENVLDIEFDRILTTLPEMTPPSWLPTSDYIFVPGSFWTYRNLEIVIDSFKAYKLKTQTEISLVLAGPEGCDSYVKDICSHARLDKDIYIVSKRCSREDMIYSMKNSFMVIFPSLVEASPITLLEAMACECRCIAWSTKSHEHIINYSKTENIAMVQSGAEIVNYMEKPPSKSSGSIVHATGREELRVTWESKFIQNLAQVS